MKKIIPQTLLTLPILATGLQAQEKQTPPNLVFIMADQYRGDAMGCIGKEPVQTPQFRPTCCRRYQFHQCCQ